jgi:serine/threonine protein kinase
LKYCDACRSSYPAEFATCPRDQTTLRSITELAPGMILRGKYEILAKLGVGGMGAVYKARHTTFGEVRAIKFLGTHLAEDQAFLSRFRAEAVVARRLQHPNAVRVEDFDTGEDGRPFIVMEYVEGRSLARVLDAEGKLEIARAVEIGRQALAALAAAHAIGIVHRDIKPDNMVLVTGEDGREVVKILDFGLAKVREGYEMAGDRPSTATDMVLGTPQYMSPEQARGARGDRLDGRADLYSLGVTLYEMVAGRLPFHSDTPIGMVLQHIQEPPLPPRELGVPEPMSSLLMKALEKDPAQRFQTAEEMSEALAGAAQKAPTPRGLPTVAGPDAPTRLLARSRPSSSPGPLTAGTPTADPVRRPTAPRVRPRPAISDPEPEATEGGGSGTLWIWAALAAVVALIGVGILRRERAPVPSEAPSSTSALEARPAPAGPRPTTPAAPAGPSDAAVRFDVQRILEESAALKGARIQVEVTSGIVSLTGAVPSGTAGELAASLAKSVPGVGRVFSTLEVAETRAAPALAGGREEPAVPAATPEATPPPAARNATADQVRELLGRAKRELDSGNPDAAGPIFEEVLRLDPSNAIAHDALEHLRADAGRGPRPGRPGPPR